MNVLLERNTSGSPAITAWQCKGCGRLESAQPCIGVCEDRKITLVPAEIYEQAVATARATAERTQLLLDMVRRLAWTKPHAGQWQQSFEALQREARAVLNAFEVDHHITGYRP